MTTLVLNNEKYRHMIWLIIAFMSFLVLPIFISEGSTSLVSEMLILAVAACGLNLMLGYAGMVSFGAAGLYGVGAYITALLLVNAGIPFGLAFIGGPVFAGIIGIVVGWFCVRLTNVYFSLLTLAFSQIIYTVILLWYDVTHGDDGINNIPVPHILSSITNYYYFTLIVLGICLFILWTIIKSPFGKTLEALRENPDRAEFIGINVRRYQLAAFVISSVMLGVAGALYSCFNQSVFPEVAHWHKTTEMLVVCLLGGIYSFLGPLVGSIVYVFLDKLITGHTEYWSLILGVIIVVCIMFLKKGLYGAIYEKIPTIRKRGIQ